jgi:hypothetical protein
MNWTDMVKLVNPAIEQIAYRHSLAVA